MVVRASPAGGILHFQPALPIGLKHVFCAHLKMNVFQTAWGAWSISLELPAPHIYNFLHSLMLFDSVFLRFMPRRFISVFTSIHWSYLFQIYFLDCMAQFASSTEIKCLFIALYSDSKFTNFWAGFRVTPKNCQIMKHGKLFWFFTKCYQGYFSLSHDITRTSGLLLSKWSPCSFPVF